MIEQETAVTTGWAEQHGYHSMTNVIVIPQEEHILRNVIHDAEKSGLDHVVVKVNGGFEVWRKRFQVATAGGAR